MTVCPTDLRRQERQSSMKNAPNNRTDSMYKQRLRRCAKPSAVLRDDKSRRHSQISQSFASASCSANFGQVKRERESADQDSVWWP
jgi:hypothetical protein